MASFRAINASRIAFHETELQIVEKRASALHDHLVDARAALSRAQQSVEAMTRDLSDLDSRRVSIRDKIQELRSRLDPRVMEFFPAELLRAIFFSFAHIMDDGLKWYDDSRIRSYSKERALVPFTLAAVCQRWRQLAFDAHSLWGSYLSLPPPTTLNECNLQQHYIDNIICRSHSSPLDISIEWEDMEEGSELGASLDRMLRSIACCAQRWRSFLLLLPSGAVTVDRFDMFRCSTPMLEELALYFDRATVEIPGQHILPGYLPYCPKLRHLVIDGGLAAWVEPPAPMPAMTAVRLESTDSPPRLIWSMLQLSPALISADIGFLRPSEGLETWRPSAKLRLPQLDRLALSNHANVTFASWAPLLDFPKLNSLRIMDPEREHLKAILAHIGHVVTSFQLSHMYLSSEDVSSLSKLRHLKTFNLSLFSDGVSPDFFERWAADCAWPQLEAITFRLGAITAPVAAALVRAIRMRNDAQPRASDAEAMQRIKSVTFKGCVAPVWLEDQISALLPPEEQAQHT